MLPLHLYIFRAHVRTLSQRSNHSNMCLPVHLQNTMIIPLNASVGRWSQELQTIKGGQKFVVMTSGWIIQNVCDSSRPLLRYKPIWQKKTVCWAHNNFGKKVQIACVFHFYWNTMNSLICHTYWIINRQNNLSVKSKLKSHIIQKHIMLKPSFLQTKISIYIFTWILFVVHTIVWASVQTFFFNVPKMARFEHCSYT